MAPLQLLAALLSICAGPAAAGHRVHARARSLEASAPLQVANPPFEGSPAAGTNVSDGQTEVVDALQPPFPSIGKIETITIGPTGAGTGLCSGTLISANPPVILTAAHCWLSPPDSPQESFTPATAAQWYPAYNPLASVTTPYGTANITSVKLPSVWQETMGDYTAGAIDVALMFLDSTLNAGPPLPYGFLDALNGMPGTVYTAGYPGDKCLSDSGPAGFVCPLWYTACPMSTIVDTDTTGFDNCFSGHGQSGSAMWVQPTPEELLVFGVLTSAPANSTAVAPSGSGETLTLWFDITPSLFTAVRAAIADGPFTNTTGWNTYPARYTADVQAFLAAATAAAS